MGCLPSSRSQVEKAITDFNEKYPVNEGYPRFVELHVFSEVGGDCHQHSYDGSKFTSRFPHMDTILR
mgnify:CR=1 FL=1|jgi:hypothetical protein